MLEKSDVPSDFMTGAVALSYRGNIIWTIMHAFTSKNMVFNQQKKNASGSSELLCFLCLSENEPRANITTTEDEWNTSSFVCGFVPRKNKTQQRHKEKIYFRDRIVQYNWWF